MSTLNVNERLTEAFTDVARDFTNEMTSAILTTICGENEGCYRRAAQRVTAVPTMLPEMSTTPVSQRLPCSEEESLQISCLHGGTCFASLGIGETRILGCSCPVERAGTRCQFNFIDPGIFPSTDDNMKTAQLAGSITVVVLIAFAVILGLYVWLRIRKPRSSSQATNGDARVLENGQHPSEKELLSADPKDLDAHNGNYHKPSLTIESTELDETIPLKSLGPLTNSDRSNDQPQNTPNST